MIAFVDCVDQGDEQQIKILQEKCSKMKEHLDNHVDAAKLLRQKCKSMSDAQ